MPKVLQFPSERTEESRDLRAARALLQELIEQLDARITAHSPSHNHELMSLRNDIFGVLEKKREGKS